ncbi:hypothetical protein BD779DRAFT_1465429 [Infundibulicybe gibba]|nr:hypothetical protein BD779DRAFT_1465429 [Infundibulicybe gibba]
MNLTNINDPATVKALLDQLRASQAWQNVAEPSAVSLTDSDQAPRATPPSASSSVASLLSQLHPGPNPPAWTQPTAAPETSAIGRSTDTIPTPTTEQTITPPPIDPSYRRKNQDIKTYSFQQALPHIARLSEDAAFVETLKKLKSEQDQLERQLWEDRRSIQRKYEEKVKVARTKASMIGTGTLSKHEADYQDEPGQTLNDAFKRELQKFDLERVLPSWDGLISQQQVTLAAHNVPAMFATSETPDRQIYNSVSLLEALNTTSASASVIPKMPRLDFHSKDDYASIHYTTNSSYGNVGGFYKHLPTIMLLHSLFLDSTWLQHQFGDPRLNSSYNLIAFDTRVSGRSVSRPNGRHDSWVDAADLARCCHALHLPPCHILAFEAISVNAALRFAVLPSWHRTAHMERMERWCDAEDLEAFEHVGMESSTYIIGQENEDIRDDLISFWETNMPPTRTQRLVETLNILLNGECSEFYPKEHAESLASLLTSAEGGALLYTVKGASGGLNIIGGHASIVNQVVAKFLMRLPHVGTMLLPPAVPTEKRMQEALTTLGALVGNTSIASRDPMSSMSFSCLSEEVVQRQTDLLDIYGERQKSAFSPVGCDGRPFRKYSERKREHWFQSERNGLSFADSSEQNSDGPDNRIHKINYYKATERAIIKGSMAKVVSNVPAVPLQRLLT